MIIGQINESGFMNLLRNHITREKTGKKITAWFKKILKLQRMSSQKNWISWLKALNARLIIWRNKVFSKNLIKKA